MMVLDPTFRHPDGWPVLSITASPQTMEVGVVNRGAVPVRSIAGTPGELVLLFRPGVLSDIGRITAAPESSASWTVTTATTALGTELRLTASGPVELAPGARLSVRLDGVSADSVGGSRATRIEFGTAGLFLGGDAATPLTGTRLIHLSVLRRHESSELTLRAARSGSVASAGPFLAGIVGGHGVVNDGVTPNEIVVRIVNVGERSLPMDVDGDLATRFTLSYLIGNEQAPWGLLGSRFDHLSIELGGDSIDAWETDHHTIRRVDRSPWRRGDHLELRVTVHTNAPIGQAQLVATFEDLPGHDDDDLVLLVDLGPLSIGSEAIRATTSVELHAEQPRLAFRNTLRPGGDGSVDATVIVDEIGRMVLEARSGVAIAGSLTVAGFAGFAGASRFEGSAEFGDSVVFEEAVDFLGDARFRANLAAAQIEVGESLTVSKTFESSTSTVRIEAESERTTIASGPPPSSRGGVDGRPLVLNPNGSSVGIGRTPIDGYTLDVAGSVRLDYMLAIGHWRIYESTAAGRSMLVAFLVDDDHSTLGRVVLADQRNIT